MDPKEQIWLPHFSIPVSSCSFYSLVADQVLSLKSWSAMRGSSLAAMAAVQLDCVLLNKICMQQWAVLRSMQKM